MMQQATGCTGEAITVNTLTGITAAVRLHAVSALLQVVSGGPIRWYADGRTPTASAGFVTFETGLIELKSAFEVASFQAIKATEGTNATVEIMVRK